MRIKTIAAGLVLVLSLTFVGQKSNEQDSAKESIMETVFRYQMNHCSENGSTLVFFLSDQGKDFPDEFMRRFKDDAELVKKGSARSESEKTHEFIEKESGRIGVLLRIDKLKVISDDEAEVEGSCGFASWAARGYKYFLIKNRKEWIVKRDVSTWVW